MDPDQEDAARSDFDLLIDPTEADDNDDSEEAGQEAASIPSPPPPRASSPEPEEESEEELEAPAAEPARVPRKTRNTNPVHTDADAWRNASGAGGARKRAPSKPQAPHALDAISDPEDAVDDAPVEKVLVEDLLETQTDWAVRPEGPELSRHQTIYSANPMAKKVTFYGAVSMIAAADDDDTRVTYRVGDAILMPWTRDDPKQPEGMDGVAVARILAIYLDPTTELILAPLQWGWAWTDMLLPHMPLDEDAPDDALRCSKEIFWEAEEGAWPNKDSRPLVERGLVNDATPVHCIKRHATVRHRGEFSTEEELNAFLEEPDTFFYRNSMQLGMLRFEELPCPASAAADSTTAGPSSSTAPAGERVYTRLDPDNITMVDGFCGSGAVSDAAIHTPTGPAPGQKIKLVFGFDKDPGAFDTYAANMEAAGVPHVADRNRSIQEVLEGVRTGAPWAPRPGEVDILHLSPPCQSLSRHNAHKGLRRYKEQLVELLDACRDLILELRPKFVEIEEVIGFMLAKVPNEEYRRREGVAQEAREAVLSEAAAAAAAARAAGEDGAPPEGELSPEVEAAAEAAAKKAHKKALKEAEELVSVRAWLRLFCPMLQAGFQIDIRVYNSGHYGVPQARERVIVLAALPGYQLPDPPAPRYHSVAKISKFNDTYLRICQDWNGICICSDATLPPAVTALEAIDDLPRMGLQTHVSEKYMPRDPNCVSRYSLAMREGAKHHMYDHARHNGKPPKGKDIDPNLPLATIIGQDDSMTRTVHWAEPRTLSLLERRRGQSFPDRMQLYGRLHSDRLRIVGNAVPWLMAREMLLAVVTAATGLPPANDPIPILKGFVDSAGNEVPAHVVARAPAAVRGSRKRKPKRKATAGLEEADKGPGAAAEAPNRKRKAAASNDAAADSDAEEGDAAAPETMPTPKNRAAPDGGRRPPQSPESAEEGVVEVRLRKRRRPGEEVAGTFKAHPITAFCTPLGSPQQAPTHNSQRQTPREATPAEAQGSVEPEAGSVPRTPEDDDAEMAAAEVEVDVEVSGADASGTGTANEEVVEEEEEEEEVVMEEEAAAISADVVDDEVQVQVKEEAVSDQFEENWTSGEAEEEVIDLTGYSDDD